MARARPTQAAMDRAKNRGGPDGKVIVTITFGQNEREVYEFSTRSYVPISDLAARRLENIDSIEVDRGTAPTE